MTMKGTPQSSRSPPHTLMMAYPGLTLLVVVLSGHDPCVRVVTESGDQRVGNHDGFEVEPAGRCGGSCVEARVWETRCDVVEVNRGKWTIL